MLIRVRFFGELRDYLKTGWTTIEVPQGSSVLTVITKLATKDKPELLAKVLENERTVSSKMKILVNGRSIDHLAGLTTELNHRDLISILPIAGGG